MSANLELQIKSAENEWMDHYKQGPTRLRWTEAPLQVGDTAPDFEMPDSSGISIRLSNFWGEQPALILFWRQFGCGCGMERAQRLQKEYADYVSAGAKVVVIGQGEPARAAAYMQKYGIPCPILCDPEEHAYRKYGLLEGKPSQSIFLASSFSRSQAESTPAHLSPKGITQTVGWLRSKLCFENQVKMPLARSIVF